ncbi:MAG TPA: hypothetical protein VIA45_06615 [Thermoanaerobaculia bacterium]
MDGDTERTVDRTRLTDPSSRGGDAAHAFDVIVPSLPGDAFSEPRPTHGELFGFGDLLHALMRDVLGYERFAAHGGDWGSTITEQIARGHAASVVGIPLTDVPFWHALRKPKKATAAEKKYLSPIEEFQKSDGAYAMIQATRPRTLEVGASSTLRPASPHGSSKSSAIGATAAATSSVATRRTSF